MRIQFRNQVPSLVANGVRKHFGGFEFVAWTPEDIFLKTKKGHVFCVDGNRLFGPKRVARRAAKKSCALGRRQRVEYNDHSLLRDSPVF